MVSSAFKLAVDINLGRDCIRRTVRSTPILKRSETSHALESGIANTHIIDKMIDMHVTDILGTELSWSELRSISTLVEPFGGPLPLMASPTPPLSNDESPLISDAEILTGDFEESLSFCPVTAFVLWSRVESFMLVSISRLVFSGGVVIHSMVQESRGRVPSLLYGTLYNVHA